MHPCWNVAEFVTTVCRLLESVDAYALAQVSRLFLEPALGKVWKKTTIDCLLRCLPADAIIGGQAAWSGEDAKSTDLGLFHPTTIKPARALKAQDWERVIKAARRVRVLHIESHGAPSVRRQKALIADNFFSLITLSAPQEQPLFPGLVNLSFNLQEATQSLVRLLLRPTLRKVFFSIQEGVKDILGVSSLIAAIATSCSDLVSFSVYWHKSRHLPLEIINAVSYTACNLRHLTELDLPQINPVPALLPSLSQHDAPQCVQALPSLAEFHVHTTDVNKLTRFIQLAGTEQLKNLSPKYAPLATSLQWKRFFEQVSLKLRHLERLQFEKLLDRSIIRHWHIYEPDDDDVQGWDSSLHSDNDMGMSIGNLHKLTSTILQPLLQCSRLRDLCIPWVNTALDADFITKLAISLPNLEDLQLGNQCEDGNPTPVPLRSLAVLTHHCLALSFIGMIFDATEDMKPTKSSPAAPGYCRFGRSVELDVGRSKITDATSVAIFLSALFEDVSVYSELSENPYSTAWQEVDRLVPLMGMVREQERGRVGV